MSRVRKSFDQVAKFFHLQSWFRLLFLCVLVGAVAGVGALAFDRSLKFVEQHVLHDYLFNTSSRDFQYWALLLVPALGGALAGMIALWFAPEATGHGTDSVIRAFHFNKGEIRARIPFVKGICSVLTIGSGGSAGKEGPIAQIGAGFGSTLATMLRLSIRDRRILMLAGVAGGIGAIFKAPLGGALFAAEVLYRDPDFEHDAVIPGVISSVTAYSVFTAVEGHDRILEFRNTMGELLPPISFPSPDASSFAELVHYAVLSVLCAIVAFVFVKTLKFMERYVFHPLPIPRVTKPALGGLLLGLMALCLMMTVGTLTPPVNQVFGTSHPSHIMSGGHSYLQTVVNSALDHASYPYWESLKLAGFLGIVVVAKILATGFTTSSGGSGGLLFPALFLGGVTGAAYAKFCRAMASATQSGWVHDFVALTPNARAGMIMVGMGGIFAACTKTPIASLVMVSEITGSYGLVVPLMMTVASAYLLSRSFAMNDAQVAGIGDSPAHRGDFLMDVLGGIRVSEALVELVPPEKFHADTPFNKVLERVKVSKATVFPIVDEKDCLVGIFSLSDIRQIMQEQSIGNLVVAGDLGTTDVSAVTLGCTLNEALRLFTQRNLDELPVVETEPRHDQAARSGISSVVKRPRGPVGTQRVIAMLSRRDLIAAYHRRLDAIKNADVLESVGSNVFIPMPDIAPAPHVSTKEPFEGVVEVIASSTRTADAPEPDLLNEPPETPS